MSKQWFFSRTEKIKQISKLFAGTLGSRSYNWSRATNSLTTKIFSKYFKFQQQNRGCLSD